MSTSVRCETNRSRVAAPQGLHPPKYHSLDQCESSAIVDDAAQPVAVDDAGNAARVDNHGDTDDTADAVAQNPAAAVGITVCAKCKAHWSGHKTGHCTACHKTFTVVSAFDLHRAGSHTKGERYCVDPATVGLEDAGRAYPCWGHPGHTCRDDKRVAS